MNKVSENQNGLRLLPLFCNHIKAMRQLPHALFSPNSLKKSLKQSGLEMGSGLLASMMAGGRGTPLGTREKRFVLSFGFKIESEIRCSRGLSRAS